MSATQHESVSSSPLPVVILVDCCDVVEFSSGSEIVLKEMLEHCRGRKTSALEEFQLHLETKYYVTDVQLRRCKMPGVGLPMLCSADNIEASVVFCNSDADFYPVQIELLLKQISPVVKLLVFNSVVDANRERIITWCVKNEFELIELSPDADTISEAEECGELLGAKRVIQALSSHSWPDMQWKDSDNHLRHLKESLQNNVEDQHKRDLDDTSCDESELKFADNFNPTEAFILEQKSLNSNTFSSVTEAISCVSMSSTLPVVAEASTSDNVTTSSLADQNASASAKDNFQNIFEQVSSAVLNEELEAGSDFEQLFSKLWEMKQQASSMPQEQRKAYAEQITMAYWKAIGGDENEITGLSNDSEVD